MEIWKSVKISLVPNEFEITYFKCTINGQNANGILIRKSDIFKACKNSNTACEKRSGESMAISQNHSRVDKHRSELLSPQKVYTHQKGDELLWNNVASDGEVLDEAGYFLEFSQPSCLKVPLVGGKGASLAKLQNFTRTRPNSEVIIQVSCLNLVLIDMSVMCVIL